MSTNDEGNQPSLQRRASRLPPFDRYFTKTTTALNSSIPRPVNRTEHNFSSTILPYKTTPTLREYAGNQSLKTSQTFTAAHSSRLRSIPELTEPGDPLATKPEYISWLWNLVADTILVQAPMASTPTALDAGSPLDVQNFNSSIVPSIFNRYGITLERGDAKPEVWARVAEVNIEQRRTSNQWRDSSPKILPDIDFQKAAEAIQVEHGRPILAVWEELRNHIFLGTQLAMRKGTLLARVFTSEFCWKSDEVDQATFQLPPPSSQSSAPQKTAIKKSAVAKELATASHIPLPAGPHARNATVTGRNINQSNGRLPNSQQSGPRSHKTQVSSAQADSANLPLIGLKLPCGMLDFGYALDAKKMVLAGELTILSGYTFVTEHASSICPFLSVVFDEFPKNSAADTSERTSLLEAKVAVLAASALWNRLRLRKSSRAKGAQDANLPICEFMHFGLTISLARYTVLLARANGEDEWQGCEIKTLWSGFLTSPYDLARLGVFMETVLEWGSSAWKDEILVDIEPLVR